MPKLTCCLYKFGGQNIVLDCDLLVGDELKIVLRNTSLFRIRLLELNFSVESHQVDQVALQIK